MHVSYNNLWKLLIDKRMSKSELRDVMNMRSKTAAKMGKEETVSTEVISVCLLNGLVAVNAKV